MLLWVFPYRKAIPQCTCRSHVSQFKTSIKHNVTQFSPSDRGWTNFPSPKASSLVVRLLLVGRRKSENDLREKTLKIRHIAVKHTFAENYELTKSFLFFFLAHIQLTLFCLMPCAHSPDNSRILTTSHSRNIWVGKFLDSRDESEKRDEKNVQVDCKMSSS